MYNPNIYTVGGTVQAGGGIYISRQADEELLALCRQRIFAYVLTPRQMGKSSLMVRTAERLTEEDIQSVIIDLTQLGVQVTAEQWYLGLLTIIEGTLMLDTDVVQWWQAHAHLGFTQRLTQFFQQVLLAEVASPIVIFVDEIDTTLSLDFTDDFFAAIRSFYNARSYKPEFQRLSFVLIGVATPSDLIGDSKRTPFNIGQRVDLTDFTFEEAKPLAEGLGLPNDAAQQVLRWVLKWTGGHPYLSQRLSSKMREQGKSSWSQADVERLVSSTFFGAMSEQDNNLQFVRDMLTKRAPDLFSVLTTYRKIHRKKPTVFDEEQSLVKSHLKLSGVVRRENGVLQLRNQIYKQVFDEKWIKECLPIPPKVLTLKTVLTISLSVTALILGMRDLRWLEPWELRVYDQMLRSRPEEAPDQRILLVTITEADILREKWPLSDATINQLLDKLESYKPRVIGLNIYRDLPVEPGYKQFADRLSRQNNIIAACGFSSLGNPEIPPPPTVSEDRIGFNDFVADENDNIVRRSLLFAHSDDKKCKTTTSFAALLAINYLQKQSIETSLTNEDIQIGKTLFPILKSNSGSYEHLDAAGYQIMLNYRHLDDFANKLTLTELLNNQVNPNLIKDRLVIIGTTARSIDKGFYTPYSALPDQTPDSALPNQPSRMPPVYIHAQIASQIMSAVLDGEPLIWYLPEWAEYIWVCGWSVVGSVLAWQLRRPLTLVVAGSASLSSLVGICASLFLLAGWIPVIPPALALVISGGTVMAYSGYLIGLRGSSK